MSRERTPPEAGIEGCEACDETANEWVYCTGRPGCVQKGGVEPRVDAPADGGADTAALVAILSSFDDGVLPRIMRPYAQEAADALVAKDDEIARLQAEVERLTRQVDHWIGCARATESHAARLEDRRADLAARAADLALKAQAVAKADRAALALRVAEAVREACKQAVIGTYGDTRNHHRMDAIDLAAIVAAALKKEGE